MSRDAVDGATYESMRGMVYAWIGDRDAGNGGIGKKWSSCRAGRTGVSFATVRCGMTFGPTVASIR